MCAPCVTRLDFWDDIKISVVKGLVHDDVEDEGAYEEYSSEDENQYAMPEHFELVIVRDHWVIFIYSKI
jgi:hypothetical protein